LVSWDGKTIVTNTGTGGISFTTNYGVNYTTLRDSISYNPSLIYGSPGYMAFSNDLSKFIVGRSGESIYVSNTGFSPSTYYSAFTPMNIASTTSTDGTTLKYIMKY